MIKKNDATKSLISKNLRKKNEKAFKSYDVYEETIKIIDRVNYSMGKKVSYTSSQSSALNYKIEIHGISSTQEI